MRKYRKGTAVMLAAVVLAGSIAVSKPVQAKEAESGNVVVMIDPGHGGSNLGANPPGYLEKDMTLATAWAMKTELEKYEGVTVYMTRDADVDLTLEQRAEIAKSVNADFLYSLHYNMSANHYFYGAEVWAQSTGKNYAKGYSAGQLFLQQFTEEFGIFSRGVKAKLNSRGTDYYGVLRQSQKLGIPAVIVEHGHLDNVMDTGYTDSVEKLQSFGKADATAAAKYFGLKSTELGVDYSSYPKASISVPKAPVMQDLTPPETVYGTVNSVDDTAHKMGITIHASDSNSGIMYVSYSIDGGVSWSPLLIWPGGVQYCNLDVPAASMEGRSLIIRAFNLYDGMTESTPVLY